MRLRILLFILLLGFYNPIYGQNIRISGEVSSAITQEGVARAVIKLMTADNATLVAIDTTRYRMITEKGDNWQNTYADKQSGAIFSFIVPAEKEYLLVAEAKGFDEFRCRVVPESEKKQFLFHPSISFRLKSINLAK